MKDGPYKVHFQTPIGTGAGVVFVHDSQLHGGDSRMYYVGIYTEVGGQLIATVRANVHTDTQGMSSVF